MLTQGQISNCCKYIRLIRNTEKRRYATDYFNWRRGQALEPNTDDYRLDMMATQAVRLQIAQYIGHES